MTTNLSALALYLVSASFSMCVCLCVFVRTRVREHACSYACMHMCVCAYTCLEHASLGRYSSEAQGAVNLAIVCLLWRQCLSLGLGAYQLS